MNIVLQLAIPAVSTAAQAPTREEKQAVWIASAIQSVRVKNTVDRAICVKIWIEFNQEYKPHLIGRYGEHFDAFCANVERIARHNMLESTTYKQGIGAHTHLRPEDLERRNGFLYSEEAVKKQVALPQFQFPGANVPEEFDWRKRGVVTDVQDQGDCHSSWSISAVGSLVGQYILKNNGTKPFELSVQDLIDCSMSYGNRGCDGGLVTAAFEYVKEHGIESGSDYPNTAMVGKCGHDETKVVTAVTGAVAIPQNEDALKEAVATIGPISVAIITNQNFGNYDGGVFDDDSCYVGEPKHAVLVVGYGTDNGEDYWIVKNSWGTHWGERGYIRMGRINAKSPTMPSIR